MNNKSTNMIVAANASFVSLLAVFQSVGERVERRQGRSEEQNLDMKDDKRPGK